MLLKRKLVNTIKIYDKNCLAIGGTDYYVTYTFGDGTNKWYINKDQYANWISEECKPIFNEIDNIISVEVEKQKSKMHYVEECQ